MDDNKSVQTRQTTSRNIPVAHLESLLIPNTEDCSRLSPFCPSSKTIILKNEKTMTWAVAIVECKRWSCGPCSNRMRRRLWHKLLEGQPTRLITLTVNPKVHRDPRSAYLVTARQIGILAIRARRELGSFEFFRVNEATRAGWPHYHLLVRSGYIRQRQISDWWSQQTNAPIVDIRMIRAPETGVRYVLKYLTKQGTLPFTARRMSWSRQFFPAVPKAAKKPSDWTVEKYSSENPASYLSQRCEGQWLRFLTRTFAEIHQAPSLVETQNPNGGNQTAIAWGNGGQEFVTSSEADVLDELIRLGIAVPPDEPNRPLIDHAAELHKIDDEIARSQVRVPAPF
jgi:hypothetical protein